MSYFLNNIVFLGETLLFTRVYIKYLTLDLMVCKFIVMIVLLLNIKIKNIINVQPWLFKSKIN